MKRDEAVTLARRKSIEALRPHVDSWYAASANSKRRFPPLRGSDRTEVCIIGGGLTGTALACELAERGIDVVVLEANRIGWGASGRNGGQICTFFSCGIDPVEKAIGFERTKRLFDLSEAAKRRMAERIERLGISCDLQHGYYHACEGPRQLREAAHMQKTYDRYGHKTELVETPEEGRKFVNSKRYVGGLFDPTGGHIHTLNHCLGLAEAAAERGARLHEDSPVIGWWPLDNRAASRFQVETDGASIVCNQVVLACNAHFGFQLPEVKNRILPVGSFVCVTEPLGQERAKALIPSEAAICTLKHLGEYYRTTADGRLLFGARANYSGRDQSQSVKTILQKNIVHFFPELADAAIEYAWGGKVAITMNRAPHIGEVREGVLFAQGYSGQGVLLTQMAAAVLAERIASNGPPQADDDFSLFSKLKVPAFPGGRLLRTPIVMLGGLWYRLGDLRK